MIKKEETFYSTEKYEADVKTWMDACPFPLADYKDAYPKNQIFLGLWKQKWKKFCKINPVAHRIPSST